MVFVPHRLAYLNSGEVGETVGRGYYRNYYKGHMDKIKWVGGGGFSWGGVEGWGEKAYNCNRITIKILKNKIK